MMHMALFLLVSVIWAYVVVQLLIILSLPFGFA